MNYLNFNEKPKRGFGWIYMYTSPSGKKYIGQTTYSILDRARKDGSGYERCTVFYRALQKYGIENFTVEILDEVPEELLEEKEAYYISEYNTLLPNGYNYFPGGCGARQTKSTTKIDVYDISLNYITSFNSLIDAAREYEIPYQAISQCLAKKIDHYKTFVFVKQGEKPTTPIVHNTHGRLVGQYDEDDNLLNIFPSANEAARAIGCADNAGRNIRTVCSGKRMHAYGFKWKYLD